MERGHRERLGAPLLPREALAADEVQGHVDDVHEAVDPRRVLEAVGERIQEQQAVEENPVVRIAARGRELAILFPRPFEVRRELRGLAQTTDLQYAAQVREERGAERRVRVDALGLIFEVLRRLALDSFYLLAQVLRRRRTLRVPGRLPLGLADERPDERDEAARLFKVRLPQLPRPELLHREVVARVEAREGVLAALVLQARRAEEGAYDSVAVARVQRELVEVDDARSEAPEDLQREREAEEVVPRGEVRHVEDVRRVPERVMLPEDVCVWPGQHRGQVLREPRDERARQQRNEYDEAREEDERGKDDDVDAERRENPLLALLLRATGRVGAARAEYRDEARDAPGRRQPTAELDEQERAEDDERAEEEPAPRRYEEPPARAREPLAVFVFDEDGVEVQARRARLLHVARAPARQADEERDACEEEKKVDGKGKRRVDFRTPPIGVVAQPEDSPPGGREGLDDGLVEVWDVDGERVEQYRRDEARQQRDDELAPRVLERAREYEVHQPAPDAEQRAVDEEAPKLRELSAEEDYAHRVGVMRRVAEPCPEGREQCTRETERQKAQPEEALLIPVSRPEAARPYHARVARAVETHVGD